MKERYKHIIFTDNVEELKSYLKEERKMFTIFFGEIQDSINRNCYDNLRYLLNDCGFMFKEYCSYFSTFLTVINSIYTDTYNDIYIYIKNIENIMPKITDYYYKLNFFNLLNSITNKQIYFIIDIKYKDYVFNQIEEYNKHINRLRSFGEIHNQVIFVDDIEKVKQDVSNKETEMFNELDGSKCKDTESFYDEVQKQFKFPDYFERNIGYFDDYINRCHKFEAVPIVFNYIKNIKNMLPHYNNYRGVVCEMLYNMHAESVFILIDKKDKDYFLEQVEIGKKY